MSLSHTLTQTHRHYAATVNVIEIEEARSHKWPLVSDCGIAWIPGPAHETDALPLCPSCEAAQRRAIPLRFRRPTQPTYVYRHFDADGRLIYVGCTVSPPQRLEQHRQNSWWFDQVARTRMIVFPNRDYALEMERQAIAQENPRWNVRGRDRSLWTADDYRDAHFAMVRKGAAPSRINKLRSEALRRHSIDLAEEAS